MNCTDQHKRGLLHQHGEIKHRNSDYTGSLTGKL